MATAALAGIGLGALHAVTGPDHVLSLAPEVVARPRGAWRSGLSWGAGHALGTTAWLALAAMAVSIVEAAWLPVHSHRIAGAALAAMGAVAIARTLRRRDAATASRSTRGSFVIGAVHGLTGAAALLVLLPAAAAEGFARLGWIAGFGAGSTLAMAALTASIAAAGRRIPAAALRLAPLIAGSASVVVGALWAATG